MAAGQNIMLGGYEMPVGVKEMVTFDHYGPTSYAQANGDVINASDLGRGGFDYLQADMTDPTGQAIAYVVPTNGGNGNAIPSVKLIWFALVSATFGGQAQTAGTQIVNGTNLSTFSLRLNALMV